MTTEPTKYKTVGIINIFLGSCYAIVQILLLFIVYPKLYVLYEDFNPTLPATTRYAPLISFIFLLIFLSVVYVGIRLLKKPSEKLYRVGIVELVVMLIMAGYFTGLSIISVIFPIYNLTNAINP